MKRSWRTNDAFKKLDEATAHLKAAWDEMESMVEERNGVVMPLTPYPPAPSYTLAAERDDNQTPTQARGLVDGWLADCKRVRAANLPALENNKVVKDEATRYFTSLGMPSEVVVREKPKRRRDYVSVRKAAGWVESLHAFIPVVDGWAAVEQAYKDRIASIQRFEAAEGEKKRLRAVDEAKKRREKASQITLCGLIAKHNLPEHHDAHDVLDHLLGLDKYLSLAHYMQANRNDWNDGTSKARTGLYLFDVETPEDRDIHDEIQELINEWDGDGSCFRDCIWNYDVLFAKVDGDLLDDYEKIKSVLDS